MVMQTADEDAEVKMEVKEEEESEGEDEGDEESGGWKEESLVKDEESEETGGEDDAVTAAGKGKRKGEPIESPNKKQRKASTASRGTKASPTKRKRKDEDDEEVAEKKATSPKKKAKKKTKKDKKKPAPEKKAKKKTGRQKKRKAPAKRRKKPDGKKGSPSDDSSSSSSSSDSEADAAAGIQESSNQVIFPLKRITVGSWVRVEGAKDALSLKWRLRNEGTKNSEISIEMKSRFVTEQVGSRKANDLQTVGDRTHQKGRRREGNLVLLTLELTCPPIFERFMPLPGTRGNKWVRTSDFTKGDAQANKRVQLLTTGEACKKFLKLTKRWTKPILVRSLRDRPQLYWHAMLNNKMAPATTPTKLESPDAEPAVDDKAICVPVKPEAAGDDELSIQSLPQEVLMQIVGYMDAKHVLQSVSLVNHTFHSLSNDELLWKTYFRRFCGSLVYSVEEAAWDALPSRFASWKEALATTNAMCFFRTRASKRFGLKDEELVASPLRRLTKYNMHAQVVRWFILDEVASYAKSLQRERAAPMVASQRVILLDDDDVDIDEEEEEEEEEEAQEDLWHDVEEDNDFQVVANNKKRAREMEEE
ncbi:Fbox domain containing protein [Acanthamoeba castellanii str. Neff]|uniref:Fbox domain containing protein n=1 Tax=Acanthamoeba castellanii (strain ATCC 30010 / Neff) TaxID=1257118 RepID=L8H818_ACACF|nr:Fbox domain containing protein [Acanthamoeba castellanii str. Neff]ELR20586.1 Fbox domain containing protein [Acanthamoeba castellanii str. Neff]